MRLLLHFKPLSKRTDAGWEQQPPPDPVLLSGVTRMQRVSDRYVITCPSGPYIYGSETIDYMEMDLGD